MRSWQSENFLRADSIQRRLVESWRPRTITRSRALCVWKKLGSSDENQESERESGGVHLRIFHACSGLAFPALAFPALFSESGYKVISIFSDNSFLSLFLFLPSSTHINTLAQRSSLHNTLVRIRPSSTFVSDSLAAVRQLVTSLLQGSDDYKLSALSSIYFDPIDLFPSQISSRGHILSVNTFKMSSAGSSQKRSSKTPRPTPPPKVRFASANVYYSDNSDQASTATSATGATGATANRPPTPTHTTSVPPGFTGVASADDVFRSSQPTEHPALGPQPGTPGAGPGWHFSSDPCRSASSVSTHAQPAAQVCTAGHVHGPNHNPPAVPQPGVFYPLHHHHHPQPVQANDNASRTMAGEYTRLNPQRPAPVSYYPQIPDTSNGPMTHLYVPRFDPGTAPGQRPAGAAAAAPPPHYTIAHPGGLNIPVPPFATVTMSRQNVPQFSLHPAYQQHQHASAPYQARPFDPFALSIKPT